MGSANWNRLVKYGPVFLAIIGLMIITILAGKGWASLDYSTRIEEIIGILSSLLVVAIFLERALAVINDLIFGFERRRRI